MQETRLRLDPNEASDLAPLFDAGVLARNGWDRALATVLDELPAEDSLALLVHEAGAPGGSGWDARRIECKPTRGLAERTADAEACAYHDGWLYLVGSQSGEEHGPLEPRRSWLARTKVEALAARLDGGHRPRLHIARLRLGLHRAVNDALAATRLAPLDDAERAAAIDATIAAGASAGKRWAGRVRAGDQPINVEGAAFRADGRMLLGLRNPVGADGHALLVELDDVDGVFADPDALPVCRNVWMLEGARRPGYGAGVRALSSGGPDRFHVVLGGVHARFELPAGAAGGIVAVEPLHEFDGVQRVEGVAIIGAEAHYVIDEDGAVALRTLALDGL